MQNPYTTADLLGVLETVIKPDYFFLNRYFKGPDLCSVKEEIFFDEILKGLPTMAPFVSPDLPATPQSRSGFRAKSFRPAYVKPKHPLKPGDFIQRIPGEPLFGNKSPAERLDDTVIDLLNEQQQQIYVRTEYLAARALIDGKVKIEGENYITQIVDFDRHPDNTVIITDEAKKWSNDKSDIAFQLEDFSAQILEKCGQAGSDVIMSPSVWGAFRKNKSVIDEANLRRGVTDIPNLGPVAKTGMGAQYKGLYGTFSIFVYSMPFTETNGNIVNVLQEGEVLFVAPPDEMGRGGVEGVKAYGAIQDVNALVPAKMYPKIWEEQDPSTYQLMTQSAPLMVPGRPNATLKVKVF